VRFRLARKGEGDAVAHLGEMALQGPTTGPTTGDLARAIDEQGGNIQVPWGRAYAMVGDVDGEVRALLYVAPPVRLTESYAERGEQWQQRLVERVAEINLLAVDEDLRGKGHAKSLLAIGEESLRQRGCKALLVKILADDEPALGWYRRRGYTVLGTDEYAMLKVGGLEVPITSSRGEPYLVGVRRIG
jgi:ribosomal protein S18 acetylase RimI-like enzyme